MALVGPGAALVEDGASDEAKASLLLDAEATFSSYVPIDVAGGALSDMQARLRTSRPKLSVHPLCADFLRPLMLPPHLGHGEKFGFFPGSTIGNLEPAAARDFLAEARRTLGRRAWLLVGVYVRKSADILIPAYDDCAGVTAAFNLNVLRRLNREAAADFDLSAFGHRVRWNESERRIEMHLESLARQNVRLAGARLQFGPGETIHTENSYTHSLDEFRIIATSTGWPHHRVWTEAEDRFALHLLRND